MYFQRLIKCVIKKGAFKDGHKKCVIKSGAFDDGHKKSVMKKGAFDDVCKKCVIIASFQYVFFNPPLHVIFF